MEEYKVPNKTYREINLENIKKELDKLSINIEGLRDVSNIIIEFIDCDFELFGEEERQQIMEKFNYITKNNIQFEDVSYKDIIVATSGMYYGCVKNKKNLYELLMENYKNNESIIIHEDSMTAWGTNAAENYGLKIGDILKMKPGQKIEVILFDRNMGEHVSGVDKGDKYDPRTNGCEYAIYTHKCDLTGKLEFGFGLIFESWEWEVNVGYGGMFWGPIDGGYKKGKLDTKTKVGWRGPCIDMEDAKNLPEQVTHYDTVQNDYLSYRETYFLKVKRIKK